MPDLFLSPSLQPFNLYVNGGNEKQIMGYVADALEPYLQANNISFVRSNSEGTLGDAIRLSNSQNFKLHLALHSNASPAESYGQNRGVDVYYYPSSIRGKKAAEEFADNLEDIYPLEDKVRTLSTTRLGEVRQPKAPSVFLELGYHDNVDDAEWVIKNIPEIARNLAESLTEYFDIPFRNPALAQKGGVSLNIKSSLSATEIADAARAKGRYSVGLFVTGAFRESDEQLRILKISEEIALLSELAAAGIREIVIVGFPTDSDYVAAVNSYMRQASEVCENVTLGVAISSEDAVSSGISRLVACTEAYADSYFLDLRDVAEGRLASVIEKNAYFLTAYNMRLMLSTGERETLLAHAASYGVQNYWIEE